jgi:hypothetical protein
MFALKEIDRGRQYTGTTTACMEVAWHHRRSIVHAGSANINERSLAGTRDTEIAAAIWQPAYMSGPSGSGVAPTLARGQVHGFRMSVWREHLANGASIADVALLMDPWSLNCVRRVQQLTEVLSSLLLCWNRLCFPLLNGHHVMMIRTMLSTSSQ